MLPSFSRKTIGMSCRWVGLLLSTGGIGVGCGGTTEVITPPPPPPTPFVLQFRADAEDAASAEALGWQAGLQDVDLTLQPEDTTKGPPRTFRGTAQGSVTLSDLAPGGYRVEAHRWLSAAERRRLAPGDDAVGFVISTVIVAAPSVTRTVSMPASRRRSLIISEWAFNVGVTAPFESYAWGGYLELYNNADTTIYLDGMVLGRGAAYQVDFPSSPCSETSRIRSDPQGVWTQGYQKFPGQGSSYPVLPGRTVVVATDAVNHGAFYPNGLDLSRADFEFDGSADVDNPAVPNMVDTGFNPDPGGHGMEFTFGAVVFLAKPFDESTVAKDRYFGGPLHPRVPAERLLDVVSIYDPFDPGFPRCPELVSGKLDRGGFQGRGANEEVEFLHSVERKPTLVVIGGQPVLQHSRSSAVDLFRGDRTVGEVPHQP